MKNDKKLKEEIIEILSRNPIIQPACERCGIARSTLYRWKDKDKKFADRVEKAIDEGRILVSELAESMLLKAIKDSDLRAIMFWLKNNDYRYSDKFEIRGHITSTNYSLTPEQEQSIQKALLLSGIKSEGDSDGQSK